MTFVSIWGIQCSGMVQSTWPFRMVLLAVKNGLGKEDQLRGPGASVEKW